MYVNKRQFWKQVSSKHRDTIYLTVSILFDSIVFIITLQATIQSRKIIPTTLLLQRIQRDGTLYFGIILTGNTLWMIFALCGRVSCPVPDTIHLRCRRPISPA